MVVILFGKVINERFWHPSNAYSPITVTLLGITMLLSPELANALVPMDDTVLGIEIFTDVGI